MKKVKTKIVLFFLVLNCVFLFAGADEVPNTLITENPEREVKTIKAPKNRESAKMSIKVNKVDIKKIKPISRSKKKNRTVYRINSDKSSGIETKSVVDEKIVVAKDLETLERLTDKNLNIKTLKELITSRVLEKEGYKEIKVDTSEPVYIGIFRNGELRSVIEDDSESINVPENPSGKYGYVQTLQRIGLEEGENIFQTSIKTAYTSGGDGTYGDNINPDRYLPDGFYDGYEELRIYELIDEYPKLYHQLNRPPKLSQMNLVWKAPSDVATLLGISPDDFWQGDLAAPEEYEILAGRLEFTKFTAVVRFMINNKNGNSTANFEDIKMKAPYKEAYIGTVQVTAYGGNGQINGEDIPFFRHYSQLFLKLTKAEQTPKNTGEVSNPETFQNMIDFLSGAVLTHEVKVSGLEKVMILPDSREHSLKYSFFTEIRPGVYTMEDYWYLKAGEKVDEPVIWDSDPLDRILMKTEYDANTDIIKTSFKVDPNNIKWGGKGTKNGKYLFQLELPEMNLSGGVTVDQFNNHKIAPVISNMYIPVKKWRQSVDINTRIMEYPKFNEVYYPAYEPRLDALFKNDSKQITPSIIYIPVKNAGKTTYTDTAPYTIKAAPGSASLFSKGLKVASLFYDGGLLDSSIEKYYGSDGSYPNFHVRLDSSKLGDGPDSEIEKVKEVEVNWNVNDGNRQISVDVSEAPKQATPSYIPSPYVLPSQKYSQTSIAGGIRFMLIPTNTAFVEPRVYFFHYPENYLSAKGDITITHRTKPHKITIDTYGKSGGMALYVDKGEYRITISDKSGGSETVIIPVENGAAEYGGLNKYGITVRTTSPAAGMVNKIELVWDGVTASPAEGYDYKIETRYKLHALSGESFTRGKYADFVIYDKTGTISGKLYLKESGLRLIPGYDKIILPDMVQGETIDFNAVVGIEVGTTGMEVTGKLQSPTGAITLNGKASAEENEKIFLTNMDARKRTSGLFGNYKDEIHEYYSDERYFTIKGKAKTQSDTVPGKYSGEIRMNLEIKGYTSVPGFPIPPIPGFPSKIGGKK